MSFHLSVSLSVFIPLSLRVKSVCCFVRNHIVMDFPLGGAIKCRIITFTCVLSYRGDWIPGERSSAPHQQHFSLLRWTIRVRGEQRCSDVIQTSYDRHCGVYVTLMTSRVITCQITSQLRQIMLSSSGFMLSSSGFILPSSGFMLSSSDFILPSWLHVIVVWLHVIVAWFLLVAMPCRVV